MNDTILITGGSGFLGTALIRHFGSTARIVCHSHSQPLEGGIQADLRDREAVQRMLETVKPSTVIHTAAYREPDFCEENPEECLRLNRDAVQHLVDLLPEAARLVYICTDYLFDGRSPPYAETDVSSPVNVYGASKYAGEQAALSRANSLSVRVPVLVGADGSGNPTGFIQQMIDAVRSGERQEVDDVLVRFPTWIDDVARAVQWLLDQQKDGVWQVSTEHGGTRYALNVEVAEFLGLAHDHLHPSTRVIPRAAERPQDSQLSTEKLIAAGGPRCHDLQDVLRALGVSGGQRDA